MVNPNCPVCGCDKDKCTCDDFCESCGALMFDWFDKSIIAVAILSLLIFLLLMVW